MEAVYNNDITLLIVLDDTSTIPKWKTSEKQKSIVWEKYIKQGEQILKDY